MCAIVLTNSMTSSWSTSVASVNWRMSQNPKMAATRRPGTNAFRSPPDRILLPMTSAPASPKPTARREQTLVKATSRMRVSISRSPSGALPFSNRARRVPRGFAASARTRSSMRSRGRATRRAASRCRR